ncbi:hypothetical protein LGK95_19510 [Clostridium algoriphilum]|uniref:hypothetical protein n=1 Tax=Clostridium algoriphilum TaxID=198347 RepID=UPI001CF46164|nr:hypothetical protein [Clostridium algoriphilum]MCB2295667.1 hypothetical protein [Clostridium algoriphilum]
MNEKEKADYRARQEERIGGEMTSELIFTPQCCKCTQNREIDQCKQFIQKPNEYMENEKVFPYTVPYTHKNRV